MSVVYTIELLISAERREASHTAAVHQYIGKPQNSCKESVRKRYSLEKIPKNCYLRKILCCMEKVLYLPKRILTDSSARFCRVFFLHHTSPFSSHWTLLSISFLSMRSCSNQQSLGEHWWSISHVWGFADTLTKSWWKILDLFSQNDWESATSRCWISALLIQII